MMYFATLVAPTRLSAGEISAASDALRGAGGEPSAIRWLEAERAVEIDVAGGDPRQLRDALEAAIEADVFVQPAERQRRLFVADMDSTMITVECIDELADYVGLKAEVSKVTEAAMRGELDFRQALAERVALLAGLAETNIEDCIRARVRQSPGASTLVRTLRHAGVRTLLVSGGFTHFTGPVAAAIGFDEARANVLEIAGGALTGRVLEPIVDAATKRAALLDAAAALGVGAQKTVAIGDGANDLPMVETAGLGIAYHAKPKLADVADARIRFGDLTAVLHALGIPRAEWVES